MTLKILFVFYFLWNLIGTSIAAIPAGIIYLIEKIISGVFFLIKMRISLWRLRRGSTIP